MQGSTVSTTAGFCRFLVVFPAALGQLIGSQESSQLHMTTNTKKRKERGKEKANIIPSSHFLSVSVTFIAFPPPLPHLATTCYSLPLSNHEADCRAVRKTCISPSLTKRSRQVERPFYLSHRPHSLSSVFIIFSQPPTGPGHEQSKHETVPARSWVGGEKQSKSKVVIGSNETACLHLHGTVPIKLHVFSSSSPSMLQRTSLRFRRPLSASPTFLLRIDKRKTSPWHSLSHRQFGWL